MIIAYFYIFLLFKSILYKQIIKKILIL